VESIYVVQRSPLAATPSDRPKPFPSKPTPAFQKQELTSLRITRIVGMDGES
jgi:hypothetical protein